MSRNIDIATMYRASVRETTDLKASWMSDEL